MNGPDSLKFRFSFASFGMQSARWLMLCTVMALAACADSIPNPVATPKIPTTQPAEPPEMPRPLQAQTASDATITALGTPADVIPDWSTDQATALTSALRRSCKHLTSKPDPSGLTQPEDWQPLCAALVPGVELSALISSQLVAIKINDGMGLNTGYFEPQLKGSLSPDARFNVPLYKRPPELVDVELGAFRPALKGQKMAGQINPTNKPTSLVPYYDRAAIDDGALKGRGLELLWIDDPWEAFFLHVQGSGQITLPDGRAIRVGYDGQNGQPYSSVGRLMLDRGLLAKGQANMAGMLDWAHAHPDDAKTIFRENKSYIFFRVVHGDGPLGSLGVALTPERSLAVDPLFVPLGAPVWLATHTPDPTGGQGTNPLAGLYVAQDVGGAIKGPNRIDVFWGAGQKARVMAGGMAAQGVLTLLLPKASVERLKEAGKVHP